MGLRQKNLPSSSYGTSRKGAKLPTTPVLGGESTPIRAGVIKVGAGYWSFSSLERRVFDAVGEAHRITGAPVACHLEFGTAAREVLEALEAAGIAPDRIMLAHVDRNPDPGLHAELAAAGAYLGYDGMARTKYWPDSVSLDCLLRVARGR